MPLTMDQNWVSSNIGATLLCSNIGSNIGAIANIGSNMSLWCDMVISFYLCPGCHECQGAKKRGGCDAWQGPHADLPSVYICCL